MRPVSTRVIGLRSENRNGQTRCIASTARNRSGGITLEQCGGILRGAEEHAPRLSRCRSIGPFPLMLSPAFESAPSLLREGDTCWKVSTARRATLLIDGEDYFNALRSALLSARRQILIAGWDFDTRAQLPACGP